jgi:DNA repair protein RecO (recombination protein O)
MALVTTPAVVLRTYPYSETSKIVRLATRELGVQSAIAKGVLRPKSRFGAGLELLSEGIAHLYHRETRELQTLAAFDLLVLRRELAQDVGRFAGAAAQAELLLKMAPAAPLAAAYETLTAGLDALRVAAPDAADAVALRALWRLLGALGFGPALETCVRDGAAIPADGAPVAFSTAEGGVLCARCASPPPSPSTRLPAQAYRDLLALNDPGAVLPALAPPHAAAHRRLLARFVRYHFGETGSLPALDFWERHAWPPPSSIPDPAPTPAPSAAS